MQIGIEIFTDTPARPYKSLGVIKAKVAPMGGMMAKQPTIEDANYKLQEIAASLKANGVINVTYTRGISAMSWKALYAEGEAVIFESEDFACPVCAEQIKRAAQKCRFCGTDLPK